MEESGEAAGPARPGVGDLIRPEATADPLDLVNPEPKDLGESRFDIGRKPVEAQPAETQPETPQPPPAESALPEPAVPDLATPIPSDVAGAQPETAAVDGDRLPPTAEPQGDSQRPRFRTSRFIARVKQLAVAAAMQLASHAVRSKDASVLNRKP